MSKNTPLVLAAILTAVTLPVQAAVFTIGDNDGYGQGIPDGADAPFTIKPTPYDGRSELEKSATDGAQFTDTYSTTHPDFSVQEGTVATFTFANLGKKIDTASLRVDMAEFEASKYGPTLVHFNGINQEWDFDDGFTHTKVRDFELSRAVIDSITSFGELVITVDRNQSDDYYGFDYLQLTVNGNNHVVVTPIPGALWLFAPALLGLFGYQRRK